MNTFFKNWLILALTIVGCKDYEETTPVPPSADTRPTQESWNAGATFTTNGVPDARLQFTHMMKWENQQRSTLNRGLILNFFEKGKHIAVLTSDSGEIYSNINQFTAYGRVVIVSDSGVSMKTEKIYWDNQKQRIFADGAVTLMTEEDTLHGHHFESNKDLTNWKMKDASGRSARDIDLKTGTVKPRANSKRQDDELDKEMKNVLREK